MKIMTFFLVLFLSFFSLAQNIPDPIEIGFDPQDLNVLMCVIKHESGFNPKAYYKSNYGLTQINAINAKFCNIKRLSDLYDVEVNLRCALKIRKEFGWGRWSTYKRCRPK